MKSTLFLHQVFFYFAIILAACQPNKERNTASENSSWEKLGPGGGGATFIPTFSYQSPDNFLIRCDMTGSYLTKDGGASYRQLNFANGASSYAYDPSDSSTLYIGATFLNRSRDGGKTWESIFPKQSEIISFRYHDDHANFSIKVSDSSLYRSDIGRIGTIRVDPVQRGALYFSMGSYFFYTINSGVTWKREKLQHRIDYLYTNNSSAKKEVYIFTEEAIYIFDKLSQRITRKEIPTFMLPAFSVTAGTIKDSDSMVFYALHHDTKQEISGEFGYSQVWTSVDHGETWTKLMDALITNQHEGINPSYSMIACAELDASQAYVVCNRYEERDKGKSLANWYGALKTNDAGKNWEWAWKGGGGSGQYAVKDGRDAPNLNDAWAAEAFGGEYIRLMDVGVYPQDGNVAVVTDWYRTMKTTDGGKSWNEIYSSKQPDGAFISRGLDVTTAYGVHFDPFDSNHIAISYTDIGYHHSFDRGKSWIRSTAGVPSEWINTCYWVVFDPDVKDKVWSAWSIMHDFPRGKMTRNPKWMETGTGGVCVSVDGGRTWKPASEGMGMNSASTSIVLDSKSAPGNRTLYVSVYNKGVFKSTDDGKSWALKNKGVERNTCAFELTLATNGNLFLTVSATPMHKDGTKGKEYYSGAVYRSTDGAETWKRLAVTNGPLFPNGIDVDPKNPDRIYLACWADIQLSDLVGSDVTRSLGADQNIEMPGGIFMSENGGDSWISIFDEEQYVYDVTVDPYHPGRLYCNTFNEAAYRSDDYEKTWNQIKGYDFHWGHRVIVDQNDHKKVYISTFGSSVLHGVPALEKDR